MQCARQAQNNAAPDVQPVQHERERVELEVPSSSPSAELSRSTVSSTPAGGKALPSVCSREEKFVHENAPCIDDANRARYLNWQWHLTNAMYDVASVLKGWFTLDIMNQHTIGNPIGAGQVARQRQSLHDCLSPPQPEY